MSKVFSAIDNGIDRTSGFLGAAAGWLILLVAVLTTIEIIARFVFGYATSWIWPLSAYILVWFAFLAAGFGVKEGSHIRVDIVINKLSTKSRALMDFITYFIALIYIVIFTFYAVKGTQWAFIMGEESQEAISNPMWPVYAVVALGCIVLSLQAVVYLKRQVGVIKSSTEKRKGWADKPAFFVPLYIALIAISAYIFTVNPLIGIILLLFVILFGGVPVAFGLGIIATLCLYLIGGLHAWNPMFAIGYKAVNHYVLLCLPMFVMGGQILQSGKLGDKLFDLATKWIGWIPGGLAIAVVLTCAFLGAMIGSSVAVSAAVGMFAIDAMLTRRYSKEMTYGVLAAGGCLGILIPPSGTAIIFGAMCDQSVGALFFAGLVPGLIMAVLFIVWVVFSSIRNKESERVTGLTWKDRWIATYKSIPVLVIPVIVLGGIYSGIFTPTEAACVMVVYSIIVCLATKTIRLPQINTVVRSSTRSSGMILIIIVGAILCGHVFGLLRLPTMLVEMVRAAGLPNWAVIAMMAGIFIVLGFFLEGLAIMMLSLPILFPMITTLGMDPWWFYVYMTMFVGLALITPPVGLNLYVIAGIARDSVGSVIKGAAPFCIMELICVLIITLYQPLCTWLPSTMFAR